MNKKIAMSAVSIFSSLAIVGGTTFALFDDSVSQTANTFAVGNADLQIALDSGGSAGAFGETIPGPNVGGMAPGETRDFLFWLKNNSSAEIDLDLTADVTSINPAADGAQTIDNQLLIKWICDLNDNDDFSDDTASSEFSPRAWLNGGNGVIGSLAFEAERQCKMSATLPSSVGNSVSGQTVMFDVEYGAVQLPSPSPSSSPSPTPLPS